MQIVPEVMSNVSFPFGFCTTADAALDSDHAEQAREHRCKLFCSFSSLE